MIVDTNIRTQDKATIIVLMKGFKLIINKVTIKIRKET